MSATGTTSAIPGDRASWTTIKSLVRIDHAKNDLLFDCDGGSLIDMFSGNGTVWLGHANPRIAGRVADQLGKIWISGGLETQVHIAALAAVERFFPDNYKVAGLYSTGMEASEFALRVARVATGKAGVVGFENSMHGKSLATAFLGWDNRDKVLLPQFHRLPFVSTHKEEDILDRLASVLRSKSVGAVFIEPVQGSGGGYSASGGFYRKVAEQCRRAGALLVFDEILTGFYRTGALFCFSALGVTPDIALLGKAMGNGFPVSGVVVDRRHTIVASMLPGSTYAGNPLASAAICATLDELDRVGIADRVASIEATIKKALAPLPESGVPVRGRGALWIIELASGDDAHRLALQLFNRGVFVSYAGRYLRLLPAATAELENLASACAIVQEVLVEDRA